jgi:hypothetical protein
MDSKSKGSELFVKLPDTTPISNFNASTALKFSGIEQLKAPGADSNYINWKFFVGIRLKATHVAYVLNPIKVHL